MPSRRIKNDAILVTASYNFSAFSIYVGYSSLHHWSIYSYIHIFLWSPFHYLISLTFDIKEDGQLVSDAFLHCLLQSWDLLSTELLPADENIFFKQHSCWVTLSCPKSLSPLLSLQRVTIFQHLKPSSMGIFTDIQSSTSYVMDPRPFVSLSQH